MYITRTYVLQPHLYIAPALGARPTNDCFLWGCHARQRVATYSQIYLWSSWDL